MVVEPRALLAESLAAGLEAHGLPEVRVVCAAAGAGATVQHLHAGGPGVVVLGPNVALDGPRPTPLDELVGGGATVLLVTADRSAPALAAALEAGAAGVFTIDQPLTELCRAVADAARGATTLSSLARTEMLALLRDRASATTRIHEAFATLTHAEAGVLRELMDGATPETIAANRYVAVSTVRSHIRSILAKLGVNSQLAAVTLAFRSGWSDLRRPA